MIRIRAAVVAAFAIAACDSRAQPSQRPAGDAINAARDTAPIVRDSGPRAPAVSMTPCTVVRVIDGDTIDCGQVGHVRLLGIDAPEMTQPPFGAASAAALQSLLPRGTPVHLELDVEKRDQYRRVLAYVWVSGRMANWLMVRSGWTVLLTHPPNVQYAPAFRLAEERARTERRGLWRVSGFSCPPAQHRKKQC